MLAGGLGTRLRSAVADKPKIIADVQGQPFVVYILEQLQRANIKKTVLCTGYLGEQINDLLGQEYRGMELCYSHETSPMGTGGALLLSLDQWDTKNGLVLNGDSFCSVDLNRYCAWHKETNAMASMVLTKVPDTSRYGRVEVDPQGRVITFQEKNPLLNTPGWINAGIYIIARSLLQSAVRDTPLSLERDLLPLWLDDSLSGFCGETAFIDIGTPESYRDAQVFQDYKKDE